MKPTHTPGPWHYSEIDWNVDAGAGEDWDWVAHDISNPANGRLIEAAPAFAIAWSLVPAEIKQRIFDGLRKHDTAWVEKAIAKTEGGSQ